MSGRPIRFTIEPFPAADGDSVAAAQTLNDPGPLTLTANPVVLDPMEKITITAASDNSGVIFTVTGTDRYGNVQTEDITGVDSTTVSSVYTYASIVSIESDSGLDGNVSVGNAGGGATAWVPVDMYSPFGLGIAVVKVDGTTNFSLEKTYHNVLESGFVESDAVAFPVLDEAGQAISGKTDSISASVMGPFSAIRLTGVGEATLDVTIIQERNTL